MDLTGSRWRRVAAVLIVGLGFLARAPVGAAQEEYTRDWRELRSENFRLVGNASERTLRRIGERLEEFRAAVVGVMPVYAETDGTETVVVVFRHDAAMRPFKPSSNSSAFIANGPGRIYVALNGEQNLNRIIYRAYLYALNRPGSEWSRWMRVGASEFYSTIQVRSGGEKVFLGSVVGSHLDWLERAFIPLGEFLHPDTRFEGDLQQTTLAAQAWALFHFMQLGRPGMAGRLPEFNRLMAENGNDVAASARTAFGVDLDTLQSEFLIYARSSVTFPALERTLPERIPDFDLPDAADLDETAASYYLGELLLHRDRPEEARVWYERAIGLGGEYSPALTSLALLSRGAGNDAAAAAFLDRAIAAPDADYLPSLLRADAVLRANPGPTGLDQAEADLRFAIADRPESPDAWYALGNLLMRRPGTVGEAAEVLSQAVVRSAGRPIMRLAHARALSMSGNELRALGLLIGLAQSTTDPNIRRQARDMEAAIRERLPATR
jgi:tetratricopeptide (TPR) repeat protein